MIIMVETPYISENLNSQKNQRIVNFIAMRCFLSQISVGA